MSPAGDEGSLVQCGGSRGGNASNGTVSGRVTGFIVGRWGGACDRGPWGADGAYARELGDAYGEDLPTSEGPTFAEADMSSLLPDIPASG